MKNKFRNMLKAIEMEIREHKSSFIVYVTLRSLVILAMVLQIFNRNFENVFLCLLTLVLLMLPGFIQVQWRIELPTTLEIIILLFIFAAEILGEISSYYIRYPGWDTILHIINGFLMAAIGFSLVDLLNQHQKENFNLSPAFLAVVAFCFSMTIGVVWEFFEFGMDTFFGFDMQKDTIIHTINTVTLDPTRTNTVVSIKNIESVFVNGQDLGLGGYLDVGLRDTMKDLIVNFVGAVIFSVIGFFYVKNRGKGSFAKKFIPRMKDSDSDYLSKIEAEQQTAQANTADKPEDRSEG